jgi:prepilin-type N-terminal cleavage/methylation domain-containing protein
MRQKWGVHTGFTLIEILVSLFIFSLVLLGVAKGYLLVDHQMKQLRQEKRVVSLVQELVQRRYRNPTEIYFEQSLWDSIARRSALDTNAVGSCVDGEGCLESELRDYDIRWFQSQFVDDFDRIILSFQPCSEQQYSCLNIFSENQINLSFVVSTY